MGTRRKFPQVAADLSVRWCSAYLKIDACNMALTNDLHFRDSRTLVVTGERGEESCNRANYSVFEPNKADLRNGKRYQRHIDHYRPVHGWLEEKVWEIIQRWSIAPHPCYTISWARCSCSCCIFGSVNQWASIRKIAPKQFQKVADYEKEFGVTIHRTKSVTERADEVPLTLTWHLRWSPRLSQRNIRSRSYWTNGCFQPVLMARVLGRHRVSWKSWGRGVAQTEFA